MRTGQAAALAGVSIQTMRFYERVGVLSAPSRRPSGYREYSEEAVRLIRFIKRAQQLGFSLDEAKALAELRHAPGRNRLVVRRRAQEKLAEINDRVHQLRAIRRALTSLIRDCCAGGGTACEILEALDGERRRPRQRT